MTTLATLMISMLLGLLAPAGPAGPPKVALLRLPQGGVQPQVAVDARGTLHVVYLAGEPGTADVFYVWRPAGSAAFTAPIRVNSRPGSAIATGTVRGAHMALGRGGRVHVSWMGSKQAEPGPEGASPMLYARLDDSGARFEPERNVLQFAAGLDGGGSLAADASGGVYVAWHAGAGRRGETARRVWMARSADDGRTFERERAVDVDSTGACGCCGMRAFADSGGTLYLLYRAATEEVHRDMVLLRGSRSGAFTPTRLAQWELKACPMSTASIVQGGDRVLAAWESEGQVFFGRVDPAAEAVPRPVAAPGAGGGRKHPTLAVGAGGETLLVWTQGTGWQRGGRIAWQLFDRDRRPLGSPGDADGLPVWDLAAAAALPDGSFAIVY